MKARPASATGCSINTSALSEEQRATMGKLSGDLCTITPEHGVDRFIRAVLKVPIHGVEDLF